MTREQVEEIRDLHRLTPLDPEKLTPAEKQRRRELRERYLGVDLIWILLGYIDIATKESSQMIDKLSKEASDLRIENGRLQGRLETLNRESPHAPSNSISEEEVHLYEIAVGLSVLGFRANELGRRDLWKAIADAIVIARCSKESPLSSSEDGSAKPKPVTCPYCKEVFSIPALGPSECYWVDGYYAGFGDGEKACKEESPLKSPDCGILKAELNEARQSYCKAATERDAAQSKVRFYEKLLEQIERGKKAMRENKAQAKESLTLTTDSARAKSPEQQYEVHVRDEHIARLEEENAKLKSHVHYLERFERQAGESCHLKAKLASAMALIEKARGILSSNAAAGGKGISDWCLWLAHERDSGLFPERCESCSSNEAKRAKEALRAWGEFRKGERE